MANCIGQALANSLKRQCARIDHERTARGERKREKSVVRQRLWEGGREGSEETERGEHPSDREGALQLGWAACFQAGASSPPLSQPLVAF